MVQNLYGRIFFQEKVEFLKLSIWFQFYALSNKDIFYSSGRTKMNIILLILANPLDKHGTTLVHITKIK